MTRLERIETLLAEKLTPTHLTVEDDSARHAGHAGARGGAGHYNVTVVSPHFVDMTMLERHRAVYDAVGELIPEEIHALAVRALAPGESD